MENEKEFFEKVIEINRVSKKTKGGNKIRFLALVAIGDKVSRVGVASGKARDVAGAIKKAVAKARAGMVTVRLSGTTIPYSLTIKRGAAMIFIKPAPLGAGLIAGASVRSVLELAGVKDVSAKILGTRNKVSNVYATLEALKKFKSG